MSFQPTPIFSSIKFNAFSFLFHQHTPTIKIYYKWHNIFTTTTPSLLDPLVHNVNGNSTQFMYRIRLTTKLVAISFFQKTHDFHQIIIISICRTSCEVPNVSWPNHTICMSLRIHKSSACLPAYWVFFTLSLCVWGQVKTASRWPRCP